MATTRFQHDRREVSLHRTPASSASKRPKDQRLFGWRRAALTALPFAGLWWLFAGTAKSWIVGMPCILLAALLAGCANEPSPPIRPTRLPGFCLWFVIQSVRGGIDVARRALLPSLPIAPGLFAYRTRLPDGARTWLANTITLLPGTLTARLESDRIEIHAIERSAVVEAEIERAEQRIARLVSRPLEEVEP